MGMATVSSCLLSWEKRKAGFYWPGLSLRFVQRPEISLSVRGSLPLENKGTVARMRCLPLPSTP